MDARRGTAVLIGVFLSILAPAVAGAAEPVTVAPTTTLAAEPEVPAVGAKRRPHVPTSPPLVPGPDSGPPVDASPPVPEPERPAPPPAPLPQPPAPEPVAPAPPEITPVPEPAPSERAPAGEPTVEPPRRLPTTGDAGGSRYPATAGACLALGGLCIALGARRRAVTSSTPSQK